MLKILYQKVLSLDLLKKSRNNKLINIGKNENGHQSQMVPIAFTLIDEYYDRVRVRLGYLIW